MTAQLRPEDAGGEPDVPALLDAGRTAWSQGRRDDAVRRWRLASAADPALVAPYANLAGAGTGISWVEQAAETLACDDPTVLKNLGVLARRRGAGARARLCFRRALVLGPERAQTVDTFVRSLGHGARDPEALRWTARALVLRPLDERLWTTLLVRLVADGLLDEAARRVPTIPIPGPSWSTDLLDLASQILSKVGRHEAALPIVDRLIGRQPLRAIPRMARAVIHRRAGDRGRAVAEARRAVLLDPGSFDALGTLGTELCHAEAYEPSIAAFRHALVVAPTQRAAVLENYAVSLQHSGQSERGDSMLREQLVQHPARAKPYINLSGSAMRSLDLDGAARLARLSTIIEAGAAEGHYQLGFVRRHQGRSDEARALFARAIELDPDKPDYPFAQALLELGDGDPVRGADSYEVRWKVPSFPSYRSAGSGRNLPAPMWQGDERLDATLAIWGEQGVGDELWFAGYLSWAIGRVGRVILEITPHAADLMSRTFPTVQVLPRGQPATEAAMAAADLQVPLGNLLAMSGGASRTVPTGYLSTSPERVAELRRRYTSGRSGVPVVGISWRSVKPTRKLSFEAPLSDWQPILSLPDTVFVSLQYGAVGKEVRRVEAQLGVRVVVDPEIDAFRSLGDFAHQVAAVDTVVSVANSTVAMAHGLGKPMHVLLKAVQEDWRYARHRETSRWLPTARCVWQARPGDWSGPIAAVAERLRLAV